jgi:hypothetical protein
LRGPVLVVHAGSPRSGIIRVGLGGTEPDRLIDFRNCFRMIESVSTFANAIEAARRRHQRVQIHAGSIITTSSDSTHRKKRIGDSRAAPFSG